MVGKPCAFEDDVPCKTDTPPCDEFTPDPGEPIEGYVTLLKATDLCSICGHRSECHEEIEYDGSQDQTDYDGQPDEAQEWHDFDPDC